MLVNNIIDEDCINYKEISMFVTFPFCSGKCWKELGLDCSICQNDALRYEKPIEISAKEIYERFEANPLTKAFVFGGMEPLDSPVDIFELIFCIRQLGGPDIPIVIYTGYKEEEPAVQEMIDRLKFSGFNNIIFKVGRYIPNQESKFESLLGVTLASDNQYAFKI